MADDPVTAAVKTLQKRVEAHEVIFQALIEERLETTDDAEEWSKAIQSRAEDILLAGRADGATPDEADRAKADIIGHIRRTLHRARHRREFPG